MALHVPVHFARCRLFLCLSCLLVSGRADAQVALRIDYSVEHQEIDNFGASDAWSINPTIQRWTTESDEAAIERLANLLFDTETGIGLSAWRFNIGAGSAEQGAASQIPDPLRRAELLIPAPGAPVDHSKQRGQIRLLREAHERGVTDFVAFSNSPPVWATKNGLSHPGDGTGIGSSNLRRDSRAEFAGFLVQALRYLRGPDVRVPVNHVSPINEPTWDWEGQTQEGTRYNIADLKAVYRAVNRALIDAGLEEHVQLEGPEAVEYTAALGDSYMQRFDGTVYSAGMNLRNLGLYRNYIDELLGDAEMRKILGNHVSLHGYFSDARSERMGRLRDLVWENVQEASPGAKIWMSEFCILGDAGDVRPFRGRGFDASDMDLALHVAKVIHRDLVRLNASAWHWWLALTPYDYKDGLLKIAPTLEADTLQPTKVLWTLGHFSRFIRPGYRRIGRTQFDDLQGLMASVFRSPDDRHLVAVIVNAGDAPTRLSVQIENGPRSRSVSAYRVYRTDQHHNLSQSTSRSPILIPARSIVTLVGDIASP